MENAPFFEDIALGPIGGAAHWLTTVGGLRIRGGHWTGPHMKGTVLLFPGRTEYIEKYGPTAADFLARSYAIVAIDWRGQGAPLFLAIFAPTERLARHGTRLKTAS